MEEGGSNEKREFERVDKSWKNGFQCVTGSNVAVTKNSNGSHEHI